ncbi:MAG TPA: hypothetical protein VMK83_00515 [Gaiellaceae bacterium]|nr:hypothetical protein [Gaiellaceae bacterium]
MRFLDVGTGVAGLAIAFCGVVHDVERTWNPPLRFVVGTRS